MATFPPMEESAWASSVVGHCTSGTPRLYVAAANPAASPTVPPPKAITASERPIRLSIRPEYMSKSLSRLFISSPGGSMMLPALTFARSSVAMMVSRCSFATVSSVTTAALRKPVNRPSSFIMPGPICTLYSRLSAFTEILMSIYSKGISCHTISAPIITHIRPNIIIASGKKPWRSVNYI